MRDKPKHFEHCDAQQRYRHRKSFKFPHKKLVWLGVLVLLSFFALVSKAYSLGDPKLFLAPYISDMFRVQIDGKEAIRLSDSWQPDRNIPPENKTEKRALRNVKRPRGPHWPIENVSCEDFVIQSYEDWFVGKTKYWNLVRSGSEELANEDPHGYHSGFWQWYTPVQVNPKILKGEFLGLGNLKYAILQVAILKGSVDMHDFIDQDRNKFTEKALEGLLSVRGDNFANYYEIHLKTKEIRIVAMNECEKFDIYEMEFK